MHYIIIKHNDNYIYSVICNYIRFNSDYCEVFCANEDIASKLHKVLFLSNHNHTKTNNIITINSNIFTVTQVTEKSFIFEFEGSRATRFKSYTLRHIDYLKAINNYIDNDNDKDDDGIGCNLITHIKDTFYEKCKDIAYRDINSDIDSIFEGMSEAIISSTKGIKYMNYIVNNRNKISCMNLETLLERDMTLERFMIEIGYRE